MSSIWLSTFLVLAEFATSGSTTSTPVSFDFATNFLGTDGLWSAAQIRVGTPAQWLSVYPNTVGPETWVIGPDGCGGTDLKCKALRGGIFYPNQSSTYHSLGSFELAGINRLGYQTNAADYGLDNVSISDTVSAPAQVIANLFNPENFLGELGLGVQAPRFSDNTNHLSMISTLVENTSVIPSHSYGYTAGAYYAQKRVPGSLVLGGVDASRFVPNSVSFDLSSDLLPVVAIQSITVSSQSQGPFPYPPNWSTMPYTLLQPGQAARFTIDSSTPFLWMPPQVCDTFAAALNLTYNSDLQLYMFPNTTSSDNSTKTSGNAGSAELLQSWGLTFNFLLANTLDDSSTHLQIPISYNAFNLQLTYGFPGLNVTSPDAPGINYFPLRRANSTTQYTIGRAFLQESYLTVDYERNSFSVQQAVLQDTPQKLVPIARPAGSKWPGPSTSTGLSAGAKAGIAIAIVLIVLGICATIFIVLRRKKRAQQDNEKPKRRRRWIVFGPREEEPPEIPIYQPEPPSELLADRRQPRELLVDSSNSRFELPGQAAIEMPAAEVPEAYLKSNQKDDGTIIRAAELDLTNHSSLRKDSNVRAIVTERSASPAPPYSPGDVGKTLTVTTTSAEEEVSSYESSGAIGSHGSHEAAISPIGPPGSHSPLSSNGIISPTTPEMRNDEFNVTSISSGLGRDSSGNGNNLTVPSSRVDRTVSRDSRFRENLVGNQPEMSDTQEDSPTIRTRFSWEQ